MTRLAAPLMLIACAWVAPEVYAAGGGDAHGAAEGAHALAWGTLVKHALNLAILGFILWWFALPAIRTYFASRADSVRSEIETAQARLQSAETELAELRSRLDGFAGEADGILAYATETAETERARVIERAEAQAVRIREDAVRVADTEVARARQTLRDEAARLAVELAAGILREKATDEDDRRIVAEFTDSLSEGQQGRTS